MTDPDLARRAAALAAPGNPRRGKRRRHPAGTSRIVVAGLSATALFSIIATLTLSAPPQVAAVSQPLTPATAAPPPKQVIVIIHRPVLVPVAAGPSPSAGGTAGQSGTRTGGGSTAAPAQPAAAPAATPAPARAVAAPASSPAPAPAPVTTTKTS
jgi:hypothetical protein